ncbi:MAG: 5'-methylthioadenosine/adenosylhomocysteine nucleosidase [Parafannyhessea sp.]|uniref:5'-methylthioadenosine/adenosylhomocysteine nucleosidase n=1 Tax=Parafannyhessea sp. TaxID=2847324 RepID=UPI003EFDD866
MKFGIIGAMDVEVKHLISHIEDAKTTTMAHMDFVEGTLFGTPAVVVRCGVGKVNAAVCAEILASQFHVTHVVNTGVAGSLNNELNIGDILVSVDAVHHDVDVTNLGYAPGEVPSMGVTSFAADPSLREAALDAARIAEVDVQCMEGRVASGDQFVRDQAEKDRIIRQFHADCCEMEGASIAHTCWLNDIPFVIVRAISDKADGSATVSYPEFERKAAHDCARIVRVLVGSYPQRLAEQQAATAE